MRRRRTVPARRVETQIKEKEGERILSNIKDGSFVVALAINGNMLDSEELAAKIEKWGLCPGSVRSCLSSADRWDFQTRSWYGPTTN